MCAWRRMEAGVGRWVMRELAVRSAGRGRGVREDRRLMMMIAVCLAGVLSVGCGPDREAAAAALTGGDPAAGRERIVHYGCGACHTVPGVAGAHRQVGPPLAGLPERMYIAGVLANNPANLIRWIESPTEVDPLTAMPDLGVTEADARDIAAYLYTLR